MLKVLKLLICIGIVSCMEFKPIFRPPTKKLSFTKNDYKSELDFKEIVSKPSPFNRQSNISFVKIISPISILSPKRNEIRAFLLIEEPSNKDIHEDKSTKEHIQRELDKLKVKLSLNSNLDINSSLRTKILSFKSKPNFKEAILTSLSKTPSPTTSLASTLQSYFPSTIFPFTPKLSSSSSLSFLLPSLTSSHLSSLSSSLPSSTTTPSSKLLLSKLSSTLLTSLSTPSTPLSTLLSTLSTPLSRTSSTTLLSTPLSTLSTPLSTQSSTKPSTILSSTLSSTLSTPLSTQSLTEPSTTLSSTPSSTLSTPLSRQSSLSSTLSTPSSSLSTSSTTLFTTTSTPLSTLSLTLSTLSQLSPSLLSSLSSSLPSSFSFLKLLSSPLPLIRSSLNSNLSTGAINNLKEDINISTVSSNETESITEIVSNDGNNVTESVENELEKERNSNDEEKNIELKENTTNYVTTEFSTTQLVTKQEEKNESVETIIKELAIETNNLVSIAERENITRNDDKDIHFEANSLVKRSEVEEKSQETEFSPCFIPQSVINQWNNNKLKTGPTTKSTIFEEKDYLENVTKGLEVNSSSLKSEPSETSYNSTKSEFLKDIQTTQIFDQTSQLLTTTTTSHINNKHIEKKSKSKLKSNVVSKTSVRSNLDSESENIEVLKEINNFNKPIELKRESSGVKSPLVSYKKPLENQIHAIKDLKIEKDNPKNNGSKIALELLRKTENANSYGIKSSRNLNNSSSAQDIDKIEVKAYESTNKNKTEERVANESVENSFGKKSISPLKSYSKEYVHNRNGRIKAKESRFTFLFGDKKPRFRIQKDQN